VTEVKNMDENKKKKIINLVIIFIAIAFVISGIVFRFDVEIAMRIIESAWKFQEENLWVNYAAKYLIWSEHPSTYDRLQYMFLRCRESLETPQDKLDYSSIQAAYILGMYQGDKAFTVLTELFALDYSPEWAPSCVYYAHDALVMKGQKGYDFLLKVALGEVTPAAKMRYAAIQKLGESKDPEYIEALVQIGNEPFESDFLYESPFKIMAIEALETIGTGDALEAIGRITP
jgi:hypothetical protein